MDFELLEEHRMLQDTVRRFVRQELLPVEPLVLERDTHGHTGEDLIPPDIEKKLLAAAQEAGLWGLDVPEEFGGLNLGALPKCIANVRQEASMLKVFATEMATRVADRAMQMHGGMGMSKDMPLEFIYRRLRPMRIFEGPTEVHRWVIARTLLRA